MPHQWFKEHKASVTQLPTSSWLCENIAAKAVIENPRTQQF